MKLAKLNDGPELFFTLQGEGVSVGLPAVFVRSSRCNLHCHWCDTDHTWNFEGTAWTHEKDGTPGYRKHRKEDVTFEMAPEAIAERVAAFPCRRVVLTGGEPLIQEAGWLELIAALRRRDPAYVFEVETNGTLAPSEAFVEAVNQFNVSPKLSNSGMAAAMRLKPDVLRLLVGTGKAWFKFVVATPADLDEVLALVEVMPLPKDRILLMPEGRTPAELDQRGPWLADLCRDQGFRFCDRLHVRLWGDKRGV
ncbi:7-carboxy-7-deazaguanine synthase QueE [Luteolibacter sp. LG18]|uniref:7-carboxy-7-deazaguanine synthase QueE n=1 Tax=Luteolibacter sp. LG18 TaxID=2819286 RepID=UPI0030C75340